MTGLLGAHFTSVGDAPDEPWREGCRRLHTVQSARGFPQTKWVIHVGATVQHSVQALSSKPAFAQCSPTRSRQPAFAGSMAIADCMAEPTPLSHAQSSRDAERGSRSEGIFFLIRRPPRVPGTNDEVCVRNYPARPRVCQRRYCHLFTDCPVRSAISS